MFPKIVTLHDDVTHSEVTFSEEDSAAKSGKVHVSLLFKTDNPDVIVTTHILC